MSSDFDEEYLPLDEQAFQEPNLHEEMRLGVACRALIESEPYKLILERMRKNIVAGFEACPIRDTDGLVRIKMMQQTLDAFHELLVDTAVTGRMAAIQLTEKQEAANQGSQSAREV